ncbi:MAG: monovalent cation/H+ antiporter complex subunit F [Lachnospiraceae bacterium]|nr:monovalent cation/H+ antiporter complex subunit F [Lachnospiraceae bacterium]
MSTDTAYRVLYQGLLVALSILIGIMLIRAIRTKGATERILCVNMLNTMVIASIAILSRLLGEGWLLDVALIYAMISFVSVLMLSTTRIPPDAEAPHLSGPKEEDETEGREA